jgi:hypothetical protein
MRNKRMANTQRKHSKGIIKAEHFRKNMRELHLAPTMMKASEVMKSKATIARLITTLHQVVPSDSLRHPSGRDGLSDCRLHHKSNIMLRVKKSKNYNDSRLRYAVKQHVLHENISPATPSILRPHTHPHSRCLNKHHDASTLLKCRLG